MPLVRIKKKGLSMKICTRCKTLQPLSNFTKKRARPDGLNGWCKDCEKDYRKNYYKKNKVKLNEISKKYHDENKEVLLEKSRQRYQENQEELQEKSLEYYHNHKEEKAKYSKKYRKKNKEHLAESNMEWKANNQEKINETRKIYTEKNKDKIATTQKLYRKNNPEKIIKIKKDYFEKNKDKINLQRRKWAETEKGKLSKLNSRHKRRAQKKQTADGSIPLKVRFPLVDELQQMLDEQENICYMPNCDTYISRELGNIHLEHIIALDNGGTHSLDNVAWSCDSCNLKKGTKIIDGLQKDLK